ncbi:diacylglycerol acyltransferase-domain-containing protein [Tricladium varicosporioides]|nr:diacylglycerol acyltransferase-domain-containing protein [Hymenoscyphus varicosporioides]
MAAPLSEPSQPEERNKQHLPPKSYADAAEEESLVNGTNGSNGINGGYNESKDVTSTGANGGASKQYKASVLGIVASDSSKDEQAQPGYERQISSHEYSATGIDNTPKTIPKNTDRRSGSQKSSRSQHKGSYGSRPATPNGANTQGNHKVKDNKKDATVFEKVEGTQNGRKLISVKPAVEYEKNSRKDEKRVPKQSKEEGLSSGKIAGQRWQKSGIRFAPMNVPLQRRLQTLVVLLHTLCIAISVSLFFFLCAIPLFWPLLIPYMIYCLTSKAATSGTLSHRSEFLRSLPVWSLFASYFPARLHRTQELPATRKYIFGYHPHGILSLGAFGAFATEALGFSQLFPGIKNTLLTLDSNFRIPIYRDYALAMGISSVSKESCENLLSKGGPNKVCLEFPFEENFIY